MGSRSGRRHLMRTLFRSRLAVPVPDGWSVSETLTLRSPDGTQIEVHGYPAPEGLSPAAMAEAHLPHLQQAFESFEPADAVAQPLFGGRDTIVRRFEAGSNGTRGSGVAAYTVGDGLACVAVAALGAAGGEDAILALLR